jgi:hypothetical protein
MTTERWIDETLDRFASAVGTSIQANNEQIAANSQAIASRNGRMILMESAITELSQTQLGIIQEFSSRLLQSILAPH